MSMNNGVMRIGIISDVQMNTYSLDWGERNLAKAFSMLAGMDIDFLFHVGDLANNTDAQFQEINKYIRFEDGNIILGEVGNEITLKIENDRIGFLQNGAEVAYFSNRKLYIVDGEFLGTLKLGNYAFEPQEDGSLTFGLIE